MWQKERRHGAIVQYQDRHTPCVASRAQEGKGVKNKIARSESGAFKIVVKPLRTDTWSEADKQTSSSNCSGTEYLLHLI